MVQRPHCIFWPQSYHQDSHLTIIHRDQLSYSGVPSESVACIERWPLLFVLRCITLFNSSKVNTNFLVKSLQSYPNHLLFFASWLFVYVGHRLLDTTFLTANTTRNCSTAIQCTKLHLIFSCCWKFALIKHPCNTIEILSYQWDVKLQFP